MLFDSDIDVRMVVLHLFILFFILAHPKHRAKTVKESPDRNGVETDATNTQEQTDEPTRPSEINHTPFPSQEDSSKVQSVWHVREYLLFALTWIEFITFRSRFEIVTPGDCTVSCSNRDRIITLTPVRIVLLKNEKESTSTFDETLCSRKDIARRIINLRASNPYDDRHQTSCLHDILRCSEHIVELTKRDKEIFQLQDS